MKFGRERESERERERERKGGRERDGKEKGRKRYISSIVYMAYTIVCMTFHTYM